MLSKKGFSLIEILLVFAVGILLIISGFMVYNKVSFSMKEQKIEEKIEMITEFFQKNSAINADLFRLSVLSPDEKITNYSESVSVLSGVKYNNVELWFLNPFGGYYKVNYTDGIFSLYITNLNINSCVKIINKFGYTFENGHEISIVGEGGPYIMVKSANDKHKNTSRIVAACNQLKSSPSITVNIEF